MSEQNQPHALWLRTRYKEGQFEGEACLLVYDVENFSDALVGTDIKQVFEKRASTANIFIVAPFLSNAQCRKALETGIALERASAYLSAKSGRVYLVELEVSSSDRPVSVTASRLTWSSTTEKVDYGPRSTLDTELREGWLFHLFDSNAGLVVAPPGVHFRKSSEKHADKFLRAANTLTSSNACGLLAMFALAALPQRAPKQILVDTAPLLSMAYAMMRIARLHGVWSGDVPASSFGSYGGQAKMRRLSINDIILISATTSGGLASSLIAQRANEDSVVTLFYLCSTGSARPSNVLCDLTVTAERGFGYQAVRNYPFNKCALCKSDFILAELEGDQFLLQQRQHRLLRFIQTTQSEDALKTLTELCLSGATEVVMRPDASLPASLAVNEGKLLSCPGIRKDIIRHLRRYIPQPLALVVRVNITEANLRDLLTEAGLDSAIAGARVIEKSQLSQQPMLSDGQGVLVIFGCLSSHTAARETNASLRSIVNNGNVAYVSALTIAETPEQYVDLKTFLGYGERGPDTFTYRDARRLALPGRSDDRNPWEDELDLLNRLPEAARVTLEARRTFLSTQSLSRNGIFWPGFSSHLAIQRDFVYLDTGANREAISQADVFAVVSNLFASARAKSSDLTKKPKDDDAVALSQSVYGHVLLTPEAFGTFNDAVLKASLLRAARKSDLMYAVDAGYSRRMTEIVLAELSGWNAGTGDALPEMLVALATERLKLQDADRCAIRDRALAAGLPDFLTALAAAIPG